MKLFGVERRKHAPKRVLARNAAAQRQERLEPSAARIGELLDVIPAVGPGDHREDRDHHDVHQGVPLRPLDARVLQRDEVLVNPQPLHPLPSNTSSRPWTDRLPRSRENGPTK